MLDFLLCQETFPEYHDKQVFQLITYYFQERQTACIIHTKCFTALFLGPPGWAGARKELLDFMVQGKINRGRHTDHWLGATASGLSSALLHHPRIFLQPDALPATQPTVSKHWRQTACIIASTKFKQVFLPTKFHSYWPTYTGIKTLTGNQSSDSNQKLIHGCN